MDNNNINWVRNKIFDQSQSRQPSGSVMPDRSSVNTTPSPPVNTAPSFSPNAAPPPTRQINIVASTPSQNQQGPPPVMDRLYIPGYLSEHIGQNVRAEFIIGTNQFVDKAGKIVEVGVNFFVLEDLFTRAHIMCDLYSVKFVTTL